jgi:hypothetical protein
LCFHGRTRLDAQGVVRLRDVEVIDRVAETVGVGEQLRARIQIEFEADRLEGGSVTAEFRNVEEGYMWGAYLWNGAFRVGTSADRLVLG